MKNISQNSSAKTMVIFTEPHAKEFFSMDKNIMDSQQEFLLGVTSLKIWKMKI